MHPVDRLRGQELYNPISIFVPILVTFTERCAFCFMRSQALPRLPMRRSLLLFAALLTLLLVAGVVFILVLPGMSYAVPVPTVVPGPVKIVTLVDSQTAGYANCRVRISE